MRDPASVQSPQGRTTHARFCVSSLPETVRYDAWRDSIGCLFDVELARTSDPEAFRATLDTSALDNLMVARTRTSAQRWSRSSLTVARNGLDHYMLQTYLSGSQRCEWSGGSIDMPSQGVLVYDLSREMRSVSSSLHNISIVVPRAALAPLLVQPDDQHMRAIDMSQPLGALLRDHMVSLATRCPDFDLGMGRTVAPATAHLVAACLNGAISDNPRQGQAVDRVLLDRLRRDIEQRLEDPELGPDDLLKRHSISRSLLYRLFEPEGGVAAYIRERRLRTAMSRLTNPALLWRPIGMIAEDLGFSGPAEFSRAFHRRFGLSPRAARHYGGSTRERTAHMAGVDRSYESWLQTLTA